MGQGEPFSDESSELQWAEHHGLILRISENPTFERPREPVGSPAIVEPLTDEAVVQLLARLEPLPVDPEDVQEFAFRPRCRPQPQTGRKVEMDLGAAAAGQSPPPAPKPGTLEVLSYAPAGEVQVAQQLTIVFSRAMADLSSGAAQDAEGIPVTLSPQPAGRWRWLDTRTLTFEPPERFPMATEFTVQVPVGTRALDSSPLPEAVAWTFGTPPPRLVRTYPTGTSVSCEPILFLGFDQPVDPSVVVTAITTQGQKNQSKRCVRLATDDEARGDAAVRNLIQESTPGTWLAVRPCEPLSASTQVTVAVAAGIVGTEGLRPAPHPQKFSFTTPGPLRVVEHEVGWEHNRGPGTPWSVQFSNPLDKNSADLSQVRIDPELPQQDVQIYAKQMTIHGKSKARTTYRLTLPGSLCDALGRRLAGERVLEFKVGPAPPSLFAATEEHVVLDPSGPAVFPVLTVNQPELHVALFAVTPEDWHEFQRYRHHHKPGLIIPGRQVLDAVVPLEDRPDEQVETLIDLSPTLRNGRGHAIVSVIPKVKTVGGWVSSNICTWVQVTETGLTEVTDGEELVVWTSSLRDGTARPARVELLATDASIEASSEGVARLPIPGDRQARNRVLVARAGDDVAMLPHPYHFRDAWQREPVADELLWYVFSDRGVYRPGETVRFHGWIRCRKGARPSDVHRIEKAVFVRYEVSDGRSQKFAEGRVKLDPRRGFDLSIEIPQQIATGQASLFLRYPGWRSDLDGYAHHVGFQVEEYRVPEYEVGMTTSDGPHIIGGSATATTTATYYAGGPLTGGEVQWHLFCRPAHFVPPGREDYAFGQWRPFWSIDEDDNRSSTERYRLTGATDGAGRHNVQLDFLSADPPQANLIAIAASVTDVNRQQWSASTVLLVHPAEEYAGLRCERAFVRETEPLAADLVVNDLEGRLLSGRKVECRVGRIRYEETRDRWVEKEDEVLRLTVMSGLDPVPLRVEGLLGGQYRLTATLSDAQGRPSITQIQFWVCGGAGVSDRFLQPERAELIPSKKEYEAGETAEVLVRSALFPAEGLLTVARAGIASVTRFSIEGPLQTLTVPISEEDYPQVEVHVDLLGTRPPTDEDGGPDTSQPPMPAYARGEVRLSVPPRHRALTVRATPLRAAMEPGGETELQLEIRNAAGNPTRCEELAVVVADEAVLALSRYALRDPLEVMYAPRHPRVVHHELREAMMKPRKPRVGIDQNLLPMAGAATCCDSASDRESSVGGFTGSVLRKARACLDLASTEFMKDSAPIDVRRNFNPVALFLTGIVTDEQGRARVPMKLPDSLTRYRVMVVAAASENLFGKGEAAITARLPLMVRPSPPRFLNFGDRCELPVVVHNAEDAPQDVALAVDTVNLDLTAGAGRVVSVPPGDRVEVAFPVAALKPGRARFQVAAVSASGRDAARGEFPVWTPASTEATAIYGEIDEDAVRHGLAVPPEAVDQFGGLELSTSATALAALTDAVLYLVQYPYECAEQVASRLLAVAALRDVLGAFEAKGLPKPAKIELAVRKDIELLRTMQNVDGGFAFWRRGDPSWPFLSVHVPHALARVRDRGYPVPDETVERSLKYLRDIRRHAGRYDGREVRWALEAYAFWVRALLGDVDRAAALELLDAAGLKQLPLEAVGWLLGLFAQSAEDRPTVDEILRHFDNRAAQTAATAHFATAYADGAHLLLHSDRRADAIILESLIAARPEHPLVPKLAHGLTAHRVRGRWESTQENAFVLLALDRYFRTYEAQTPEFVARAWLGQQYMAEHAFQGRTAEQAHWNVPMVVLRTLLSPAEVVLAKEGLGRMYYRLGLEYVPAELQLEADDRGFQVSRAYRAVDAADAVRRGEDGTWQIRAGALVRVRLELVAPSRRYHVALVDPLPAGLEVLNPVLAVTAHHESQKPPAISFAEWWKQHWFDHQNLRDERVEVFAAFLREGVYQYEYFTRATTRGIFIVPPPKAEEMYHPDIFGRGPSDRVIVE